MTYTFLEQINVSVQVGDLAWYINTSPNQGVTGNTYSTGNTKDPVNGAKLIGVITQVTQFTITVASVINPPFLGFFILFSKNDKVNKGDLLGYYARIKMINHSKRKIELFSVGSEISESSK